MKYEIIIRPEAEDDIREAYQWYENHDMGLGAELIRCIEDVLENIQDNPKLYQIVYKDIRRALIRRFPYGVFYLELENKVIIIAVFHVKQDPESIKDRT